MYCSHCGSFCGKQEDTRAHEQQCAGWQPPQLAGGYQPVALLPGFDAGLINPLPPQVEAANADLDLLVPVTAFLSPDAATGVNAPDAPLVPVASQPPVATNVNSAPAGAPQGQQAEPPQPDTVEGSRPHRCRVCRAVFLYKGSYTAHYRSKHQGRVFSCQCCGKQFNDGSNHSRHEKRCRGRSNPVQRCKNFARGCGYVGNRSDNVKRHQIKCDERLNQAAQSQRR